MRICLELPNSPSARLLSEAKRLIEVLESPPYCHQVCTECDECCDLMIIVCNDTSVLQTITNAIAMHPLGVIALGNSQVRKEIKNFSGKKFSFGPYTDLVETTSALVGARISSSRLEF